MLTKLRGLGDRVFFGWWIVFGTLVSNMLLGGLVTQAYGTYVVAWQEEFGWSKTALASAYALMQALGGVIAPFQGGLLLRYGTKAIVRLGLLLMGAGLVLLGFVSSLAGLYAALMIAAVGVAFSGFLSLSTVVVNWFERRRATALALMQSGLSLGGFVVPLVAVSLLAIGWRATAVASGILMLLASVPVGRLMRSRPEDYGMHPDGAAAPAAPAPGALASGLTARQALRTRAFWLLAFGHALALMVVSAVQVHLVVYLHQEGGFPLTSAAGMFALVTGCSIGGQLAGGFLGDRVSKRLLAGLAMIGHGSALLLLQSAQGVTVVVLFALLHGVAWGVRGPLMMALRADYFGRASFAAVMGFSSSFAMAGMMIGPLLLGALADASGSYGPGFVALGSVALVGSALFFLAAPPTVGAAGERRS